MTNQANKAIRPTRQSVASLSCLIYYITHAFKPIWNNILNHFGEMEHNDIN